MYGIQDMGEKDAKANLRQDINDNLKRVFNEALEEDVPDRFKQLLAQLKAKEAHEKGAAAKNGVATDPGSSGDPAKGGKP
ncbi:MAG: NepR family anti-sigma factor [Pseudorhodobacter sp.]|nr:NepR family anti-sigma factor [Pseudorhodobacter sp.]